MRRHLRAQVAQAALARANALLRDSGTPDCDHCGQIIADRKPGKRFCCKECCRGYHWAVLAA